MERGRQATHYVQVASVSGRAAWVKSESGLLFGSASQLRAMLVALEQW
jgi:hypothetical protein